VPYLPCPYFVKAHPLGLVMLTEQQDENVIHKKFSCSSYQKAFLREVEMKHRIRQLNGQNEKQPKIIRGTCAGEQC